MGDQEQSEWQQLLGLKAALIEVVGFAGAMIAIVSYLLSLPMPLVLILGGASIGVLCVGLMAHVFLSNNRPVESLSIGQQSDLRRLTEKPMLAPSQKANLNLECEIALAYVGLENDVFQCYVNFNFQAALVEFRNRAVKGQKVPSFNRVKAHITYYDMDGKKAAYINAGSWIEEKDNFVRLHVADSRQLIIALRTEQSGYVLAVQNNRPDTRPETNLLTKLTDEQYRIDVELVDLDQGEIIGNFKFNLFQDAHRPRFKIEPAEVKEG